MNPLLLSKLMDDVFLWLNLLNNGHQLYSPGKEATLPTSMPLIIPINKSTKKWNLN